ncbi:hypothetical protein F4782DRAFT_486562 [Xylaria castorea]|nr:hypothetical protein F4782DRAFT_486562 [Xylaria castorea]
MSLPHRTWSSPQWSASFLELLCLAAPYNATLLSTKQSHPHLDIIVRVVDRNRCCVSGTMQTGGEAQRRDWPSGVFHVRTTLSVWANLRKHVY